jgi:hypothetical protein
VNTKKKNDPSVIVEWAVQGASNGDNKFLDGKLEQLRIMDRSLSSRPSRTIYGILERYAVGSTAPKQASSHA